MLFEIKAILESVNSSLSSLEDKVFLLTKSKEKTVKVLSSPKRRNRKWHLTDALYFIIGTAILIVLIYKSVMSLFSLYVFPISCFVYSYSHNPHFKVIPEGDLHFCASIVSSCLKTWFFFSLWYLNTLQNIENLNS